MFFEWFVLRCFVVRLRCFLVFLSGLLGFSVCFCG